MAAAVLLVGGTSFAGATKTKVFPIPQQELPSAKGGCNAGTTTNGVTTIPIKVVEHRVLVEPLVNVCFDGKGPYPMLVDTGAAISVISTGLAEELGLQKAGAPGRVRGAGCTIKSRTFYLPRWSVGGVELEGGEITTLNAPGKGPGHPRGSLGADVLARFGAARIDFRRETLTLQGEEGKKFFASEKNAPMPTVLLKGKPQLDEPMQVNSFSGISQTVSVQVGATEAEPWLIDTGAAYSFIDAGVVKKAGLKATGTAQRGTTYCSIITVPEYRAPSLGLESGKLKPQTVAAFKGRITSGVTGTLGSYSLLQFGSVVFDWTGGRLLLGAG